MSDAVHKIFVGGLPQDQISEIFKSVFDPRSVCFYPPEMMLLSEVYLDTYLLEICKGLSTRDAGGVLRQIWQLGRNLKEEVSSNCVTFVRWIQDGDGSFFDA